MSQTYTSDSLRAVGADKGIPDATVARLPVYLRALRQLADQGIDTVSSQALAEAAGVSSAQLRKDLSHLGSYGTRGVGYDVQYLLREIGREVGSAHDWPVIIVGLGNLGTALANYSGFYSRGFRVVGLIDPNPDLVGQADPRPGHLRPGRARGRGGPDRRRDRGDRHAGRGGTGRG